MAELLVQMVETCLPHDPANISNTEMRDCMVQETYNNRDLPCAPKIVLITTPSCNGCETAEEQLKELINQGKVEILDYQDPRAYNILKQTGDNGDVLPTLAIVDCSGNLITELEISSEKR